MKFNVQYYIGVLLLIAFVVKADNRFKKKFGDEFGSFLKEYHGEYIYSILERYTELLKNILRETNPSGEEKRKFQAHLQTILNIQDEIGKTVNDVSLKKIENFQKTLTMEVIIYRLSPGRDQEAVKSMITRSLESEIENSKSFIQKIYNKFHKMFEAIPEEESQHAEFEEIDELIGNALEGNEESDEESDEEVLKTEDPRSEYVSVLKKLRDFFKYPDYIRICDKKYL